MKARRPVILLSFDIEEFDLPREHGREFFLAEGVKVSEVGVERVLEVLKRQEVRATFFCTGNFAQKRPELIRRMVREGHEVGCHGVDHFRPGRTDFLKSKKIVEKVVRKEFPEFSVAGYRAPRMQEVDYQEMARLGYLYDSSVNPTCIPGRYNNFSMPRRLLFVLNSIYEIPTSVVGRVRFPLFWFSLHWLPVGVYFKLCEKSIRETGYLAVYFHPWEFGEIKDIPGVPGYIKHKSGEEMVERLEKIVSLLKRDNEFVLYREFI